MGKIMDQTAITAVAVEYMPLIVTSGEYTEGATLVVPKVAAVAVHTVPGGRASTNEVAEVTLLIGYQPATD